MDTTNIILESFESDETKKVLNDLIDAAKELSTREPQLGFHHKFYIPGWISFIQLIMVENKMSKYENAPFYKDKDYLDFVNWMIESAQKLADIQSKVIDKESDRYKTQCNTIISVLQIVSNAWFNCAPEVASIINRKLNEDTKISLAGIVYGAFEEILKPLGYPQSPVKEPKYGPSFSEMGNQLLATICNIILFSIIIGIGSLIFG